ncbi:MAG: CHAD domain-containing protein [Alphaproteobacteria bacterium]|nr:CHAD domain-containing protein [Alphaproteobacteria bacterium]
MTYRLDPATPMSEALRRVAFGELEIAHAALASPPELHSGVHSARKCLKRLRSLLLLIRPGIPEPVFASLFERLTTVSRGLAPARDAQALMDAVNKLERDTPSGPGDGTIQSLRGWLMKRRQAAEHNLERSTASDAKRALLEIRPAIAGLAVYPDDFTPLEEGLRGCYRATRKFFRQAYTSDSSEEMHDWRKGVQHHWRQMQLLAPCWPSELNARVEAARALSQILGDDHDLFQLSRLMATPTMTFGTQGETAAFLKRCRKRQKALRKEARVKGERLFVEKAGPFAERIDAYWRIAAGGAGEPVVKVRKDEARMDEARQDNVVAFGEKRTPRAG